MKFYIFLGHFLLIVSIVECLPQECYIRSGRKITTSHSDTALGKVEYVEECKLLAFYQKGIDHTVLGLKFYPSSLECFSFSSTSAYNIMSDSGIDYYECKFDDTQEYQTGIIYDTIPASSVNPGILYSLDIRYTMFYTQNSRSVKVYSSASSTNGRADASINSIETFCGENCAFSSVSPSTVRTNHTFNEDGTVSHAEAKIRIGTSYWNTYTTNCDRNIKTEFKINESPTMPAETWIEQGLVIEEHKVTVSRKKLSTERVLNPTKTVNFHIRNRYHTNKNNGYYIEVGATNGESFVLGSQSSQVSPTNVIVILSLPFYAIPAENITAIKPRKFVGDTVFLEYCKTSFATYEYNEEDNTIVAKIPYLDIALPFNCVLNVLWKVKDLPELTSRYQTTVAKQHLKVVALVSHCHETTCTPGESRSRIRVDLPDIKYKDYADFKSFRIMHLATRACIKPTDDGSGVKFGSCDYIHKRGEGNSIQDPKTSKFLNVKHEDNTLMYSVSGMISHIKRRSIEIYNTTHRICLKGNDVQPLISEILGNFENCSSEFDKYREYKLLPVWDNMNNIYLRSILTVSTNGVDYVFVCNPGSDLKRKANCYYSVDAMDSWTAMSPMITGIAFFRPTDNSIYGMSNAAKRKFKLKLPPRSNYILDVLKADFYAILNGVDYQLTSRLDDKDYSATATTAIDGISDYQVSSKGLYKNIDGSWSLRFLFAR